MQLEAFEDGLRVRVLRFVGKGGMGEVYEAMLGGVEGFERPVALKMIRSEAATRPEFMRLFVREARLAALLLHPNVIQVYYLGHSANGYYLLMEYVEGIDLEVFIERHRLLARPVSPEVACYVASGVLRALDHALNLPLPEGGALGLVHCDVSPRNIMLSIGGNVKIGDFGIARALRDVSPDSRYMGRPEYVAPEVLEGGRPAAASDVFSVGLVLYEMLTLHQPFYNRDLMRTVENVRYGPVPNPCDLAPDVPERLANVVLAAVDKRIDNRYQDAFQFLEALEGLEYLWPVPVRAEQMAVYLQGLLEEEA